MNEIISEYKELLVYIGKKSTGSSGITIDEQAFSQTSTNCILMLYVDDEGSFNTIITTLQAVVDAIVLGEHQPALFEPWYELRQTIINNKNNVMIKKIVSALPDCALKNEAISNLVKYEMEKDH